MDDPGGQRIGLLGGSFDPPHHGHLALALAARDVLDLSAVWFVPSAASPSRRKPPATATGAQRLEMARLAFGGRPSFVVSDLELRRDGPSYTVDTIRTIAADNPRFEIFLLLGSDRAMTVEMWRGFAEMRSLCRFAAAMRSGSALNLPDWIASIRMPALTVSSTMVRDKLRQGLPVDTLIAPSVLAFIRREGLYGS